MCKQNFKIRKVFITFLIGIFILSGCGQSENTSIDNNPLSETISNQVNAENDLDSANAESSSSPFSITINTKAEDLQYFMEDDIDLLRALHRCKSFGQNIYLVHGEPDLYIMPIGTNEHIPANISNPKGMSVCNIAIDTDGRIHLLAAGAGSGEWFILQLDENNQAVKTIDISAYFETRQVPLWFLVDKDGTYYLQWPIERNGIIVDSEGVLKHKTTPEALGTKWIYEAAVGKDGEIYLVHGDKEDKLEIARLDAGNCLLEGLDPALYFPGDEVFSLMSEGTDTSLLLFSPYSGVWACDTENGILENRVPISEIDFGSGTEYWPFAFLPDGRLFLIGQTINKTDDAVSQLHLKYIPVDR